MKRPNSSIESIQERVDACSQRCTRGHEREGEVTVWGPELADVMEYLSTLEKRLKSQRCVTP
jgi:hypothetical protein